jgi:hypothetical protein
MDKAHFKQGDYVAKLFSCKISTLVFINMKHTLQIIIDSLSYFKHISQKINDEYFSKCRAAEMK